jgi:two-component system, LytTR family, response regulator
MFQRDLSLTGQTSSEEAAMTGPRKADRAYIRRVPVKQPGGVILFVPVEQIDWIEASDQYVRLHAGEKRYLMRESISHLGSQLDPAQFRRIHRSTVVNLDRIRELHVESQTQRWAVLVNGDRLQVSQAYWEGIQEALVGLG